MRLRDPERAIVAAGETVPDWSGGTRLGETLRIFLNRWGQRGLARGAVVVVFSDGWERGDPDLLDDPDERLRRIAHRVVWVNPHRGKAGYVPVQAGVRRRAAALRRLRRRPLPGDLRRADGGGRPVRDVLPELMAWWRGRRDRSASAPWWRRSSPPPGPPGASMLVGPDGDGGRLGLRRLRRGRGLRAGPGGRRVRRPGAGALRRLRRRRLRRRPDLRRDHRRLRRAGRTARPSPSSGRSPPTSRPAVRSRSPP